MCEVRLEGKVLSRYCSRISVIREDRSSSHAILSPGRLFHTLKFLSQGLLAFLDEVGLAWIRLFLSEMRLVLPWLLMVFSILLGVAASCSGGPVSQ